MHSQEKVNFRTDRRVGANLAGLANHAGSVKASLASAPSARLEAVGDGSNIELIKTLKPAGSGVLGGASEA